MDKSYDVEPQTMAVAFGSKLAVDPNSWTNLCEPFDRMTQPMSIQHLTIYQSM